MSHCLKQSEALRNIAASAIGNIDATPQKDQETLQYNKITNSFDILEKCLDCYALLIRIASLTRADIDGVINS